MGSSLPLSQTRRVGNLVFTSGQVGVNPATGKVAEGDIAAQTRQVLENLRSVLSAVDLTLDDVVKTTVFLVRAQDFDEFNSVYREFFSEPLPARSTVSVELVSPELLIEIEAVAQVAGGEK
ncbi:MAG: Rid family detoxifying hydrolase [Pseudaminobacter sp.]